VSKHIGFIINFVNTCLEEIQGGGSLADDTAFTLYLTDYCWLSLLQHSD